jgi:glutamine amidotransferase
MAIIIIDYGLSNLNSVLFAFKNIYNNTIISSDKHDILSAKLLVLPGIGTYKDGMENINKLNLFVVIKQAVLENNIPIIGICLGMHLLSTYGYEGGKIKGLNLIEGEVIKLNPEKADQRIPHVGWNEVMHDNVSVFKNIPTNTDFYFVHSYIFNPRYSEDILAKTNYCGEIVSGVQKNNIYGFQFHPEKSQLAGKILLKNIVSKYIK